MKPSHHFRDQLSAITGWFDQWNGCEQTVALCSLVKKIGPTQTRFLALVLEQNIAQCLELQMQEQEANDPAYISSLSAESKETAVSQLLSHLPLLRPGNEEAKAQYLRLIPKILAHSIGHSIHIEESRQLLSYSLIHPAISNEDRCTLNRWLRQLEDRIHNSSVYTSASTYTNGVVINSNGPLQQTNTLDNFGNCQYNAMPRLDMWRSGAILGMNGNSTVDVNGYSVLNNLGSNSLPPGIGSQHMALHGMNSAPGGVSAHPDGTQTLPMPHSRIKRSSSLTPPCSLTHLNNCSPSSLSSHNMDQENLIPLNGPCSLRPDHAPLSPQSSVTSSGSGSESQKDEKDVFSQDGTGMKDVPCWLKGLRLHKYAYIFKNMTYEEMMSISEEKLEKMNITKGARHKIVLSIQKLRERQDCLRSLEKDLQEGEGTIRCAINEIKGMIQTPIKAYTSPNSFNEKIISNGESESCSEPPSAPPSPTNESDGILPVADGDLPGQITRLMGKICSNLLISPNQDENLNFFVMLTDKCLSHEAFSPVQKRRLFSWKQQIQKACHPLPPRRSLDNRQRNKWNGYHNGTSQNVEHDSIVGGSVSIRRRIPVQYQQPPQRMPLARQNICGSYTTQNNQRNALSTVIKRPSLQDHTKPHVQIQRTNSAPVRPNPLPVSMFGKNIDASYAGIDSTDPEINNRLESLCLSVTEHALGSFDGAVPLF
ncbi:protein Smaug homolog 1-like [Uloborus diversus]|uniref:protein Smaug homolog 1-like n=1 Tax=Uloborus diversus TaxID=327109 RepID=UPI00240A3A7E|nr:protein Smaug homolog 1-like [Uloborus diversus]